MSFSGLLNSLWNSKSVVNKSNKSNMSEKSPMRGTQGLQSRQDIYNQTNINTSVPISQGKEYILYKQSKVNSVNNEINNFKGNDYQNSYYQTANSNYNSNYGNIREGFDGMIGSSRVNTKNQKDSSNLQTMEDEFNRSISSYATTHKNLMDKSQQFLQGKRTYGKNIHVIQAANTDDIVPNWVGCYKPGNDGLLEQTDLGNNVTLTDCKVRASDLGYSTFALRQRGTSPGNTCFVGDSIDKAQSSGLATKSVLSYSFKKAEGANVGGLMMNGQIGMYEDDITNDLVTDLTAVADCDIIMGGKINANTTVATWGYNCNGTAQSPFTPPPPQPAPVILTPDGYTKYSNQDSTGNDIIKLADGTSLADLAAACDKNANCSGFNSGGWVKSVIMSQNEWDSGNYNGKPLDLYVKNKNTASNDTTPPQTNCSQYGDNDTNMPDACYEQMWKDAGCTAPVIDDSWWKTQTKAVVKNDIYLRSTPCHTDPNTLVRGQTVYTGGEYTYASESARDTEYGSSGVADATSCKGWDCTIEGQKCPKGAPGAENSDFFCKNSKWTEGAGSGATSIWIGDGYTDDCINRGQTVYTGCGYTYATESARNEQCGSGGTSLWIGDGYTSTNTTTDTNSAHYKACYAPAPIVKTGSTINTASIWSKPWIPINDGTNANSLSELNDGTIICTNAPGNVFTRPNISTGWTQISVASGTSISSGWNGKCIDQNNGSQSQGLQMQLWDCVGNAYQQMTYNNSNQTVTVPGGLCLDAYGGGTSNGTQAIQWGCHGGSNQRWVYGADKTLRPQHTTGKCLDALGFNNSNGAKLGIWDCNGAVNQTWNVNQIIPMKGVIQISNGTFVGIGQDNNIYTKTELTGNWSGSQLNGFMSITQLNDGTFIGIGLDNTLLKSPDITSGIPWRKITCPQSCCVTFISTLNDGSIVGIGTNGLVYTRNKLDSPWVLVDGSMPMSSVTQLKDGTILGTSQSGSFFRK
jgi:hypothetical protein